MAIGTSSPNSCVLQEFHQGPYYGILIYTQTHHANQVQASLSVNGGALMSITLDAPFSNLSVISQVGLGRLKASLSTDYFVRVAKVGEKDFKVYFFPKLLGGGGCFSSNRAAPESASTSADEVRGDEIEIQVQQAQLPEASNLNSSSAAGGSQVQQQEAPSKSGDTDILEGRVLESKEVDDMIGRVERDFNLRRDAKNISREEGYRLWEEQNDFARKKRCVGKFYTHQRAYCYAVLSELRAAYSVGQIMDLEESQQEKSAKYHKAMEYADRVIQLLSVSGKVMDAFMTFRCVADPQWLRIKEKGVFLQIYKKFSSPVDFERKALAVAVDSTNERKVQMSQLGKKPISPSWREEFGPLSKEVEDAVTKFVENNPTEAHIWGRFIAYKVIRRWVGPKIKGGSLQRPISPNAS